MSSAERKTDKYSDAIVWKSAGALVKKDCVQIEIKTDTLRSFYYVDCIEGIFYFPESKHAVVVTRPSRPGELTKNNFLHYQNVEGLILQPQNRRLF